jgi:hypothetical protein
VADNRRNMARRAAYELPAGTLEIEKPIAELETPRPKRLNPRDLPSMADYGFRPVPDTPRIRDDG